MMYRLCLGWSRSGGSTISLESVTIIAVNTPQAKAGGFGLRLKAGLIGRTADCPLSQNWEG